MMAPQPRAYSRNGYAAAPLANPYAAASTARSFSPYYADGGDDGGDDGGYSARAYRGSTPMVAKSAYHYTPQPMMMRSASRGASPPRRSASPPHTAAGYPRPVFSSRL